MERKSVTGNGNRAHWRDVTIVDGAVYRLPSGELVQASVVPHPEALPEYWEDLPDGGDAWPVKGGLDLWVLWPEPWAEEGGCVGPSKLRLMTAACVAGVPWALGYYVYEWHILPEVWREIRDADGQGHQTGWRLEDLVPEATDGVREFQAAVKRAEPARRRLMNVKERMERERERPDEE